MSLRPSPEQQMIREEAMRILAERASPARRRAVVEAGTGIDTALWELVGGDLGWPALPVPEAAGGLGLALPECLILLETIGSHLAALPYWSSIGLALPLLIGVATQDAQAKLLPRLAAGEAASVAWGDLARPDPETRPGFTAQPSDIGWRISGCALQVTDLMASKIILVPAKTPDGIGLFCLDLSSEMPPGCTRKPLETLDATRQIGMLHLKDVPHDEACRIDRRAPLSAWARAGHSAQLALAAEQIGAAAGALALTQDYIAERVQFGRTIASFQAIKHRMARLEVDLAEARALLAGAGEHAAKASEDEVAMEAHAVRALASNLLLAASEEAIQLHGGVGFTWEYDPHLYLKRAEASASWLGRPEQHLARLAERLLPAGSAA